MKRQQHGIALVTAILVVAVAALAATALLVSANMAIHRTASLRDTEQGLWMGRGVEAWVRGILKQDAANDKHDALDEAWAQPVDYLPVEQGFVRGRVVDQQGLFNLNNLAVTTSPKGQLYEQQFLALLANFSGLTVPPGLVSAIRDWLDADQTPSPPMGAEDSVYLNLELPYRTADRLFTAPSELLAVQGVTPEIYKALMTGCPQADGQPRPCITVLPGEIPINVNTAPEGVLRSLPVQDDSALRAFLTERIGTPASPGNPAKDVASFIARNIYDQTVTLDRLAVASQYFQMEGEVVVGSSRTALYSLIHRPQAGPPVVLAHSAAPE